MQHDADCIFCKIVSGVIPSAIVYSDEAILSFLDVGPLAEGHLLIIPKEHYGALVDLPSSVSAQIASVVPQLGRALLSVTGAEGFNLLANNGAAAGQVVPHAHWHLIPRRSGDSLGYRWNAGSYAEGRMAELKQAFESRLS